MGGVCSASFFFNSGRAEIKSLQVSISVIDQAGKEVTSGVLEIEHFGTCSATQYEYAYLESAELCADDLIIIVNKATAVIEGKQVDLLKEKALSVDEFKPFKITMGNGTVGK